MNRDYQAVEHTLLQTGTGFVRPKHDLPIKLSADSPALEAMTDLHKASIVTVRANTPLDKANERMIRYGVRMLVVLDEADAVAGLITANDVLGEKPVRHLQQMGGTHTDIKVADIMTPQRQVEALPIALVRVSKVGNIIATLKKSGRQHALVIEQTPQQGQALCGLFSLTQIARQLGVTVQGFDLKRLFADIEQHLQQP